MTRVISEIIIHCSATRPEWFDGKTVEQKRDEIRNWHVKDRGWKDIGYALVIDRDGKVAKGRDLDKDGDVWEEVGAHTEGHNSNSIGLCLIGGFGANANDPFFKNFTLKQDKALRDTLYLLRKQFPTITKVSGHNEYAQKACPGFDVKAWYSVPVVFSQKEEEVKKFSIISMILETLGKLFKTP